jgi:small-conductance mechanosensitive channel
LLLKFEADGFELELGFWIGDPENGRGNVLSDVNRAIWKALQEHQVEIPYPQREVRIIGEVPPLEAGKFAANGT